MTPPTRDRETQRAADVALIRRYLGVNMDSYRADQQTLSIVAGSFQPRVTFAQALAALDRLALPLS